MAFKKGSIPWNKGKIYNPRKRCDACGTDGKDIFKSKKYNKFVCDKHYWQLKKYGHFISDEEAREKLRTSQSKWIGKQPWNYKGGRATLNMVVRRCSKYKQWVRSIFIRDDFTCQKCFVKGTYLEADHYPVRFATIMDEEGITTYEQAMENERLWDKDNGRTLCRKCHRNIKI